MSSVVLPFTTARRRRLDVDDLLAALLDDVRDRLVCGEISSSRLASLSGCSQSHLANVLSSRRDLCIDLACDLQRVLVIDVRDLVLVIEAGAGVRVVRSFD